MNQNSPLTILIVWNNNLNQECSEYLSNLMVNIFNFFFIEILNEIEINFIKENMHLVIINV